MLINGVCLHEVQEFDSMKDGYEWFKCSQCNEMLDRYQDCGGGF